MPKSRKSRSSGKSRSSMMKTIQKTTDKALPTIDKGLTAVGTTAENVTKASIPVIEKGVSAVYGTMATGLDLGVKGVKSITKGSRRNKSRRSHSRSLSRSLSGGRRTRRHRRHRRH